MPLVRQTDSPTPPKVIPLTEQCRVAQTNRALSREIKYKCLIIVASAYSAGIRESFNIQNITHSTFKLIFISRCFHTPKSSKHEHFSQNILCCQTNYISLIAAVIKIEIHTHTESVVVQLHWAMMGRSMISGLNPGLEDVSS